MEQIVWALIGGAIIGTSTSVLLLFKGRIFGISGILGGLVRPKEGEIVWRLMILAGLVSAGWLVLWIRPEAFDSNLHLSRWHLVIAGLLVGFGTQLGGGCTSGHGVCGISRLSKRSIVATVTFMTFGAITVFVLRHLGGNP